MINFIIIMPFCIIIIPKLFLNIETRKKKTWQKCGQKLFYHHKMVPQTLTWGFASRLTLQEIFVLLRSQLGSFEANGGELKNVGSWTLLFTIRFSSSIGSKFWSLGNLCEDPNWEFSLWVFNEFWRTGCLCFSLYYY